MRDRRDFLRISGGALAAAQLGCADDAPRWSPDAVRKPAESRVAILPVASYDEAALVETVLDGLRLFDLPIRDRRVVLKPNLVEFDPRGVINTHPAVIASAVEAFRLEGARDVVVAEGPGHRRDTQHLLEASGLADRLRDMGARYVDLNHDEVRRTPLRTRFTELGELYLPVTVLAADLFVSMPKLKTHHWTGVTLSMKNLFGVVPGAVYGWPKNPLHWAGLDGSILDINATLVGRRFNIVDGVTGMEGNGPIQGEPVDVGVLLFGEDPVATDAEGARLMGLEPWRLPYLSEAAEFLGNVEVERIRHLGEARSRYRRDFRVVDGFAHARMDLSGTAGP